MRNKKIRLTQKKHFSERKNSLFELDKKKKLWIFNSVYSKNKIWFEIIPIALYFDESLYLFLKGKLKKAKKYIELISKEPIGHEIKENAMYSCIYSVVEKSNFITPNSIFSFIGEIFIKLLMNHYLTNGNKRLALLFLIFSLDHFGYFFTWSKGIYKDNKIYKTDSELFVVKLELKGDTYLSTNRSKIKKEITDWIERHSLISVDLI